MTLKIIQAQSADIKAKNDELLRYKDALFLITHIPKIMTILALEAGLDTAKQIAKDALTNYDPDKKHV